MTTETESTHEDLEREVDLRREQLAYTLATLDRRWHDLHDVKLQVRRHPLPLVVLGAAVLMFVGLGISFFRRNRR